MALRPTLSNGLPNSVYCAPLCERDRSCEYIVARKIHECQNFLQDVGGFCGDDARVQSIQNDR